MSKRKPEYEIGSERKKQARLTSPDSPEFAPDMCEPKDNPDWALPVDVRQKLCPQHYEWFMTKANKGCCRIPPETSIAQTVGEALPRALQGEIFEFLFHPC